MTRAPVLLTVCLGNICRSPTAQAALIAAARAANRDVTVRSAGTGSWHVGDPPDPRMSHAARAAGLHLEGPAERVTAEMLAEADVVFAMDTTNLADIRAIAEHAGVTTPCHLFRAFDPAAANSLDVPDPYYGGPQGFADVVEICQRTASAIIAQLDTLLDRDRAG
ncbi:MAG: low molecular weight protein-tyrosine-phosphatase [Nitriliruptoraceae bacterium]